ncbi:Immunoglobulin superfamily DCC subclass member 3 [Manis javanica]|nr:Immunoglobulin superfamily DCC subclass member 3 [Manis javanica]
MPRAGPQAEGDMGPLLFLLLLQNSGLSHFHQHPKSVEVEQGAVARLQCLIRRVPEPSISWEHNGLALRTADHRLSRSSQRQERHAVSCPVLPRPVGSPRLLQESEILSGPQNLTVTVHQMAVL